MCSWLASTVSSRFCGSVKLSKIGTLVKTLALGPTGPQRLTTTPTESALDQFDLWPEMAQGHALTLVWLLMICLWKNRTPRADLPPVGVSSCYY